MFFRRTFQIGDFKGRFDQVKLRHFQRPFRKIDSRHRCAQPRHRFGEDAAAAADVEHFPACERRQAVDPAQAQRVEVVQRPELALRVPPAVREFAEFRELGRVCVRRHGLHKQKAPPKRGFLGAVRLAYLRVPMTSISTRRFFWRPSLVVLLATGCFSPLPSV